MSVRTKGSSFSGSGTASISSDEAWFHAHAHSHYSVLDGMPSVQSMVETAVRNGQPALGLTDHGSMSGAAELYLACQEAGIKAFPGEEFYIVRDINDKTQGRTHLTMLALNFDGFQLLKAASSRSHQRDHYHYRPRIDLADLASMASSDIAVLTGCHFGLLVQTMLHSKQGFGSQESRMRGKTVVDMLGQWFPHLFIEVQHHHTQHENEIDDETKLKVLADLSFITGVPLIVTQDSHYNSIRDKELHDLMKQIAYRGTDDATFPGDSYHLARTRWVKSHYKTFTGQQVWAEGLRSCQRLLDLHKLEMPALDKYQYHIPKTIQYPDIWLNDLAIKKTKELGLIKDKKYSDQLMHELDVIGKLGMAGYFHLIYDGIQHCQRKGIMVAARGSANGSLVCYVLGITQLDPIKWNLMFERFLSLDRKKPPDIDLDIEHERRNDVVEFYRNKYDLMQIGTYNTLGEDVWGKGSVLVQYLSWARQKYGKAFKQHFGHVKLIDDLPDEIAEPLHALGALRIKKSAGAHAAGFVLGTKAFPIDEYIPTMLIPSSGHTVTQFTMEDVETLGYIKVDLLGQRTLSTIKRTLELIDEDGIEWIPDDDKDTMRHLREGRTNTGIFQFEGWAAAKGCRDLAVRRTKDCIAIMALYRPAVMSSGYLNSYLSNRRGQTKPDYPHPIFKRHLRETYGVAIYQEQVMAILRDMGVPYEELNEFLSALKMSNHKTVQARRIFREQRAKFIDLCVNKNGMAKRQAVDSWDAFSGFAEYGFNRAHATAYGLLGYRMAYLKVHYPLEFFAALLETTAGTPKESPYVAEARHMGVRLRPADVNKSGVVWKLDGNGVRRGLTSIKGVGEKAAVEIVANAPYEDVEDLIERCNRRVVTGGADWIKKGTMKGVMEALRNGGALRSLGVDAY